MPNRIALFKFTRCKNDKWITNEAEENYVRDFRNFKQYKSSTIIMIYNIL